MTGRLLSQAALPASLGRFRAPLDPRGNATHRAGAPVSGWHPGAWETSPRVSLLFFLFLFWLEALELQLVCFGNWFVTLFVRLHPFPLSSSKLTIERCPLPHSQDRGPGDGGAPRAAPPRGSLAHWTFG